MGFLIAGLALAASMSAGADEAPQRGGILTFAVSAVDPPSYDIHATALYQAVHLLSPHYSTLLKLDPANYPAVIGDLAESWTVSPDQRTFTFRLRPNITFHDGSPLTALDVKASYDRIRNPPQGVVSVRQGQFAIIDTIETPDPLTVVIRLKSPSRSMIYAFAVPWNAIYSAAKLREDPRWPATHVMGSGPYRFVEHVSGSHWVGARFDGYFKPGLPYLDGFRAVFTRGAAMINAIQGGQVDGEFRSITPGDRDRLTQAMGERIVIRESSWISPLVIIFNTEKKPFDDPRVRRALSLAVDRWQASEVLSRQSFLRAVGGFLRPGSALAAREADLVEWPGFAHDPAPSRIEARRLLREAGVERLSFKLTNRDITNLYLPAAVFLIDQWRRIGVTVEHLPVPEPSYQAAQTSGNFDVMLSGDGDAVDEPDFQLVRYQSADVTPANRGRYVDRTLDTLYERQRLLPDEARYQAVRDFETRMMQQAYIVPMLWWHRIVALSPRVRNWHMSPSHLINQDLEAVWLAR
jgi:peptide/nickel transport system substrate-binding protein